ncbi:MAG TPA: hypothetical protein DEQ47_09130 [Solibacterales bacterium]|nr:hypothetical protein [Bryobacterales bacterium]
MTFPANPGAANLCSAVDALLAEYVEGTLEAASRALVDAHLAACPACAALAADAAEGLRLLAEAREPEVPAFLVNRILHQAPTRWTEKLSRRDGLRGWINRRLEPVLQPRFVMGAMMTVLSLAMMTRCAGAPGRALTTSDLDPVKVWASFDDRLHRTWERTVMTYESMRVVYEVQTRLREWRQSDAEAADAAIESRQLNKNQKTGQPAPKESGKTQ